MVRCRREAAADRNQAIQDGATSFVVQCVAASDCGVGKQGVDVNSGHALSSPSDQCVSQSTCICMTPTSVEMTNATGDVAISVGQCAAASDCSAGKQCVDINTGLVLVGSTEQCHTTCICMKPFFVEITDATDDCDTWVVQCVF